MDGEPIVEAIRLLADFADDHAEEVYGDNETEYPGSTENISALSEAADAVRRYLDN